MKTCTKCDRELPLSEYHKRTYPTGRIAYQAKCRECSTKIRKNYYKPHEKIRRQLGITVEEFNALMLTDHCDICGVTLVKKKCIDHDHGTEKVRGVLCHNCNTALGLVKDNTEVLSKMIDYINQPQER